MKAKELTLTMDHKIETTRFGNTTLSATFTMELQSPNGDTQEVKDAIQYGTKVLMESIASQKTAIDDASINFFVVESRKELMNV